MHANEIVLAAEGTSTLEEHLAALRNERPRVFWLGLTLALFAHAALIIGIGSAKQRTLGTPDGAADAIAVEIVDGATLKDSMAPPTPPAPAPGGQQPSPAQQPAQPQQAQPEVPPPPPPPEVAAPQPPPAPRRATAGGEDAGHEGGADPARGLRRRVDRAREHDRRSGKAAEGA